MIPSGPVFTSVPASSSAGDFLGMGAVGERLYSGVFPGVNNAVRHIRPYAAICWMVFQLRQRAFVDGRASMADYRAMTKRGIWKIQLLLNWTAHLTGAQMFPGTERFKDNRTFAVLRPETWPNIKISFWDTAWYKPGLVNGLRFLNEGTGGSRGTYDCTPAGLALAEAYHESVCKLPGTKLATWLADPDELDCPRKRVLALDSVLNLDKPSVAERSAFLHQYLGAEHESSAGNGRNRRKGLLLALRALEALEAEEAEGIVDTLRHTMAAGRTPRGVPLDLKGVESAQLRWSLLQTRQLQRLALEALLGLAERHILQAECKGTPRQKEDIASAIAVYLKPGKENTLSGRVGVNLEWIKNAQGGHPTVQIAGLVNNDENLSFAVLKAALRERTGPDPVAWPACARLAMWALLVCVAEVENMQAVPGARDLLEWDADKLALGELRRVAHTYRDRSMVEFACFVVERFVIGQHLAVSVARSDQGQDGKQRFVFTPERDGLTRFMEAGTPRFVEASESGDILYHAMLLLENCRLVGHKDAAGFSAGDQRFTSNFFLKKAAKSWMQKLA